MHFDSSEYNPKDVSPRKIQTVSQSIERLAQAANYAGNLAGIALGLQRTLVDDMEKVNGVAGEPVPFVDYIGKTMDSQGIVEALSRIVDRLEVELGLLDKTLSTTRSLLR